MLLSAYVFDFQCKMDSLQNLAGSYIVQIKKNWKEYLGPFEPVECRAVPRLCMCLFLMVTSPSRFTLVLMLTFFFPTRFLAILKSLPGTDLCQFTSNSAQENSKSETNLAISVF